MIQQATISAARIRRGMQEDEEAIAQLLTTCQLPNADFAKHLSHFLIAEIEHQLVGVVGLEWYHPAALLRSVAVDLGYRNSGLAQELVRQLLDEAYVQGIRQVFLLTMTAPEFFTRFSFQTAERTQVPEAMLASAEFLGACPASARLLCADLKYPPILVRRATYEDIPAITRIYNQGIEEGTTFETELRTDVERQHWLENRSNRYPVIVAIREREVVGWACLNPFNPRSAYRWVADLSVYVERSARSTGVGTALMRELERRARSLDFHKLVLTTFPELKAVGLYEKLNYRKVGIYREQGQLHGRWQDTLVMEKLLPVSFSR